MINSAFKIKYGAVSNLDGPGVEDLDGVDEFQQEMSVAYVTLRRPMLQERGGEAYHFMIEWLSQHSLKEYMEIIGAYLLGKTYDKIADSILDRYLFGPFKRAYKKLFNKNSWRLGIDYFSLEFLDTSVSIGSFGPESVVDNLDDVLRNLYHLLEILKTDPRMPMYISIPIVREDVDGAMSFRYVTEYDELLFTQQGRNFYQEYWVMFYYLPEKYVVYDVQNRKLIPIDRPRTAPKPY